MQIKQLRKDLITKLIRGNVDTRIKKLEGNEYDAIILAFAGIKMLGKEEKISQIFFSQRNFTKCWARDYCNTK